MSVPYSESTALATWAKARQIAQEEAGNGSSPVGVTVSDAPTKPANGQAESFLVSAAVVWPSGLVWSTDPDGGVAPTISGMALVNIFTAAGVTRAVMAATFPVPVADTAAPTWAATLTTGIPTQSSVVVSASVMATDDSGHVSYEVSTNSGSTWAAITPSGSNFTLSGLASATTYPAPRFRAKDPSGNVSAVLVAQGFTTAGVPDTIPPQSGALSSSAVGGFGFTLTVAGASDEGELHSAPYAFSTDDGVTWSQWQSAAVWQASGLASETTFQCVHRVRDAAGNVTVGAVITVTTGAPLPLWTDFDEYPAGQAPHDFTQLWSGPNTVTVVDAGDGTRVLSTTSDPARRGALAWDRIPGPVADCEVLVKWRTFGTSGSRHIARVRASGAAGGENGWLAMITSSTKQPALSAYHAGTYWEGERSGPSVIDGAWHWTRIRAGSGRVKSRSWADGGAEPNNWPQDVADTEVPVPATGRICLATGSLGTVEFAWLSVGLNGDTAPGPA